jgi:hypothetical protein
LFWRKKKNDGEIISCGSNDQRASFRVCPLPAKPIRTEFQGKSVLVHDISAGGLSFRDNDFQVGDSQSITFDLPGENVTVSAKTEIVDIDPRGMCHCRFLESSDDFMNVIHRFVLAVQKERLRLRRHSSRQVFQLEDMAAPDKALEELLEQDVIRVC